LLARRLLELPGAANGDVKLAVTVSDLGGLSGLSSSEAAEELQAMQERGWVRVSDGIEIVDSAALAVAASIR
jgi:DNA-binding IclR family transcriptional regulator